MDLLTPADLPPLPPRDPRGHKGTFGTVLVIGGCVQAPRVMLGAPALAARAALRVGAGLAWLAMPAPLLAEGLVVCPSATGLALPTGDDGALDASAAAAVLDAHLPDASCVVLGPGLGTGFAVQQLVARIVSGHERPIVADADALNALAALPEFDRELRAPLVLTPHPGEFARLARVLGLSLDGVDPARRPESARALAARLGCIVVLKGAQTVTSDGIRVLVNDTGNDALATAGTGDVLAGAIAGLVAQCHDPVRDLLRGRTANPVATGGLDLFECAAHAVHAHGRAADAWRRDHPERGLLATELADGLERR